MLVEQADARIAIVTAVGPRHLTNAARLNRVMRLPIRIARCPVWADLKNLPRLLHRVAQLDRLLDRVCHRLLDVHVLAGVHRVDGNQHLCN